MAILSARQMLHSAYTVGYNYNKYNQKLPSKEINMLVNKFLDPKMIMPSKGYLVQKRIKIY